MNSFKCFQYKNLLVGDFYLSMPFALQFIAKRHYPEVRRRFYKNVTVAGTPSCYEINLDHRKLKTPAGKVLQMPNYPLALAVSSEWLSVEEKIMPSWMHLTGLSFTAADNPQNLSKPDLVEKALEFVATDTILFRDTKEDFLKMQIEKWDPIVEWFNERFRVDVQPSDGIGVAEVSEDAKQKLRKHIMSYNNWSVSGILFAVDAIKSFILAAACIERKITPEEAVKLSLLETEYQAQFWGSVEWSHDLEKYDALSRFSAAILFVHLNSSDYIVKQKSAYR